MYHTGSLRRIIGLGSNNNVITFVRIIFYVTSLASLAVVVLVIPTTTMNHYHAINADVPFSSAAGNYSGLSTMGTGGELLAKPTHNQTQITPVVTNDNEKSERRYRHPNFTFDFPLCLVHVGKTAGSSISCGLGLMYANCEGMPREPSLDNIYYFHMKKNTCRHGRRDVDIGIATFLMTVRNPLMRIQSWFFFEKDIIPSRKNKNDQERLKWKRGLLFSECYNNFFDLVTKGLVPMRSNGSNSDTHNISAKPINMTCQQRAWS